MQGGFIGDGLVRTIPQAQELDVILAELNKRLWVVFHISTPREHVFARTRQRVWCPRCGASYRSDSLPSDRPGLCYSDGEPLQHRDDDSNKIVERRLQNHEDSAPEILAYYQKQGLLREIDGTRAIDAIHDEIIGHVERRRHD